MRIKLRKLPSFKMLRNLPTKRNHHKDEENWLISGTRLLLWVNLILLLGNILVNQARAEITLELPWSSNNAEPTPVMKPFELPKLKGDADYKDPVPALLPAPAVNPDLIYRAALNCYPEKSKFKIDVSLVAGYKRSNDKYDSDPWPDLTDHYFGIVGKIPIYSSTELSRTRDREYIRRTQTATHVAGFAQALANRNHAYREIGLYMALEARAQVRVAQGIAPTTEQITYLEKTAKAQRDIIKFSADAVEHRLALSSMCDDDRAPNLNAYLLKIAELPNKGGVLIR